VSAGGGSQPASNQSSNDYNYPVNPSSNQYPTSNPPQQYNAAPRTQNEDYPASVWTDGSFTPTSGSFSASLFLLLSPLFQLPSLQLADRSSSSNTTPFLFSDASSINIYHPSPTTPNAPVPPTKDDRLSSPPPGSASGKRSDEIRRDNTGGRQSPNMLGTSPPASNLSSSPSARIDFGESSRLVLFRSFSFTSLPRRN